MREWKWLFDSYEGGTVFITDDPTEGQEPIARMLDPTEAAKIVDAHNAKARDYEAVGEALALAVYWIETECRPDAEWVAHGHNWSMSNEDRERGQQILIEAHEAIARLQEPVPA